MQKLTVGPITNFFCVVTKISLVHTHTHTHEENRSRHWRSALASKVGCSNPGRNDLSRESSTAKRSPTGVRLTSHQK